MLVNVTNARVGELYAVDKASEVDCSFRLFLAADQDIQFYTRE